MKNIIIITGAQQTGKTLLCTSLFGEPTRFSRPALEKVRLTCDKGIYWCDGISIQNNTSTQELFNLMRAAKKSTFVLTTNSLKYPRWVYHYAFVWNIIPMTI